MADESTAATSAAPALQAQSLWRLYLLMALTLGVYLFYWLHRQLKFLYGQAGTRTRPWLWLLGAVVPLLDIWVFGRVWRGLARHVVGMRPLEVWGSALYLSLVGNIGLLFDSVWVQLAIFALYPAPLVWAQRRINRTVMGAASCTEAYTPRQWAALVVGGVALVFWLLTQIYEVETPATGVRSYHSGGRVSGGSGLYSVELPSGAWQRLPNGTLHRETDLELTDPGQEIEAWVYVAQVADMGLVERVNWRRGEILDSGRVTAVEETRRLGDDRAMAIRVQMNISVEGDKQQSLHWWITYLEVDDQVIELLVSSPRDSAREAALALAASLRLSEGGKGDE